MFTVALPPPDPPKTCWALTVASEAHAASQVTVPDIPPFMDIKFMFALLTPQSGQTTTTFKTPT